MPIFAQLVKPLCLLHNQGIEKSGFIAYIARMKQFDAQRLGEIVAKKLGPDFKSIKIIRVDVYMDEDHDEGAFVRIDVVFEGKLKDSEAIKVASAVRRIRPALMQEIDEDVFPLLSFVSKVDDLRRGHKRREAG